MEESRAARHSFVLLQDLHVYGPEDRGVVDVLIAGSAIVALEPSIYAAQLPGGVSVVSCGGLIGVPGLIDGHIHPIGGGGNEGFASRISEIWLSDLVRAGITTAVATPGIDMISKRETTVLAKAYALEAEGITSRLYVGGFIRPFSTITSSVLRDLWAIPLTAGVKIALNDARASHYSDDELIDLSREIYWTSGATGKTLVLHAHLGELPGPSRQLLRVIEASQVPADRFVVTHCNHNRRNLEAAVQLAKTGAWVDLSSVLSPSRGVPSAVSAGESVAWLLDQGVPLTQISISSDANATVPRTGPDGSREMYELGLDSLADEVFGLVKGRGLQIADAVTVATSNPARALGLAAKGALEIGRDADILVLDEDLAIRHVFAKGQHLLNDGIPLAESMLARARAV